MSSKQCFTESRESLLAKTWKKKQNRRDKPAVRAGLIVLHPAAQPVNSRKNTLTHMANKTTQFGSNCCQRFISTTLHCITALQTLPLKSNLAV